MYIQPNSDIYLCSGILLNNRYENTIYFDDPQGQYNYFYSKLFRAFNNQYYTRHTRDSIRVKMPMDKVKMCNYLFFRNNSKNLTPPLDDTFENKWFYCFITDYEYINNEVTEIFYEIDVMQTFMFDYTLGLNFVVRETPAVDGIYVNHELEDVSLGDEFTVNENSYVTGGDQNDSNYYPMNNWRIGVIVSEVKSGSSWVQPTGKMVNNVYTPCAVYTYSDSASDLQNLQNLLADYVNAGKADAILNIFMFPTELYTTSGTDTVVSTHYVYFHPNETTIDGYTPKNAKLFSNQFNFLIVSNNSGDTMKLDISNWSAGHKGNFTLKGTFMTEPSCLLYPTNYRNRANDYESGLVLDNFPQVAFLSDVFKAYWAQNKNSIITSTLIGYGEDVAGAIQDVGDIVATTASSGTRMSGSGTASNASTRKAVYSMRDQQTPLTAPFTLTNTEKTVVSQWAKNKDMKVIPPQVKGQVKINSLNSGMNRTGFTFYQVCIKNDIARRIDDYFTMFGYATNQMKDVKRNQRPHFTYIRLSTFNCTQSTVPNEYFNQIATIYNNGIRFWNNGNEIGDFTLDNTAVSQ